MIDYKAIADEAKPHVLDILLRLLPGGKLHGKEYEVLNSSRGDREAGSFRFNIAKGTGTDFATGQRMGDIISFVAGGRGWDQKKAAEEISKLLDSDCNFVRNVRPPNSDALRHYKPNSYYKPIFPIPHSAPPIPDGYIKDEKKKPWKPTKIWAYKNNDGLVNFYIARFDSTRGKIFMPLVLHQCTETGDYKWLWEGLPEPRSLYGLEKLSSSKEAPVLFCEGEKSADAAQILLPFMSSISTANGAKSPHKTDFSPLKGRDVYIWRDNDDAGIKYAKQVSELVLKAGGIWKGELDLSLLAENLPSGYDAADALSDGKSAAYFEGAFQTNQLFLIPKPVRSIETESDRSEAMMKQFRIDGTGVWWIPKDTDRESTLWLCSPLSIEAKTSDENHENWGVVVSFKDPGGNVKRVVVPRKEMVSQSGNHIKRLADLGLGINTTSKGKQKFCEYLQFTGPKKYIRLVSQAGWYKDQVFVLPGETVGELIEDGNQIEIFLESSFAFHQKPNQAGSLEDWKKNIAALCPGNELMTFAVSTAFSAPLLRLMHEQSGGFHFVGVSTTGKTTCLKIAASVYSDMNSCGSWDATPSGMQAAASANNDGLLVLDEIAEGNKKELGKIIYGIGNANVKKRANAFGGAMTSPPSWRNMVLSTGETSIKDALSEVGEKAHGGQQVRLVDIPVGNIFNDLHDFEKPEQFGKHLNDSCFKYYGTAGRAFVKYCVYDRVELPNRVKEKIRHFLDVVARETLSGASPQVKRVAQRFAIVAAAGEIATDWGLTGWEKGEADKASLGCLKAWLEFRGGTGLSEEKSLLSQVKLYIEQYGDSQFPSAIEATTYRTTIKSGWKLNNKLPHDEYFLLVLPQVFLQKLCAGYRRQFAIEVLMKNQILIPDKTGSHSQVMHVPAERSAHRVYKLDADRLLKLDI